LKLTLVRKTLKNRNHTKTGSSHEVLKPDSLARRTRRCANWRGENGLQILSRKSVGGELTSVNSILCLMSYIRQNKLTCFYWTRQAICVEILPYESCAA
jgi:hypothetical protein